MSKPDERPGKRSAFGRPQPPEEFPGALAGPFNVMLNAQVVPDPDSLEALHEAIRSVTRSAVLAGYADAFSEIDAAEQTPGGDDGGSPPGPTVDGEQG